MPESTKLVDHSLSRVSRKGLLAEIVVEGAPDASVFRELG